MIHVAAAYRHKWGTITPTGKKADGEARAPYEGCVLCRQPKPDAAPWCEGQMMGLGIATVIGPDGRALPTHPLGDAVAADIVAGHIPRKTAESMERRRKQATAHLRATGGGR